MKILGKILTSAGCMILGYYLMEVALAIHPFVGGMVFGITIVCAILFMISDKINNNTKQQIMEEIEMWLARDKDGKLAMYENKPFKGELAGKWSLGGEWDFLPENWFPEVKWSDEEPTKVKFVIEK